MDSLYKLKYRATAIRELAEITDYIRTALKNPLAADRLARDFIDAGNRLLAFPYANPVHAASKPLKHEYRKCGVRGYILFYWVDEQRKYVIISHVVYARRNYDSILR